MKDRLLVVGNLAKDVIDGTQNYGGSAANLALAAKNLGLQAGVMSVLGKDRFSSRYREFLTSEGVDLSLTPNVLEELPICTVVSRDNTIADSTWQDNGCHLAMDEVLLDDESIRNYNVVHLVSCPPNLAKRIASLNIKLSYEPGPMLVKDPGYFDMDVAKASTFIFANNEEYQVIKTQVQKLLANNSNEKPQILIVTLGSEGVLLCRKGKEDEHIQIQSDMVVTDIVDSIGSGDNFKAGFLAGYMKGKSIPESVEIGMEMGAECVRQTGGVLPRSKILEIKEKYSL